MSDDDVDECVLRDLETRIFYAETSLQALRDAARYWKTQAEAFSRAVKEPDHDK